VAAIRCGAVSGPLYRASRRKFCSRRSSSVAERAGDESVGYPAQVLGDVGGVMSCCLAEPGEGERAGQPLALGVKAVSKGQAVASDHQIDEAVPVDADETDEVEDLSSGPLPSRRSRFGSKACLHAPARTEQERARRRARLVGGTFNLRLASRCRHFVTEAAIGRSERQVQPEGLDRGHDRLRQLGRAARRSVRSRRRAPALLDLRLLSQRRPRVGARGRGRGKRHHLRVTQLAKQSR